MEGWVKFLLLETAVLLYIIWEFLSKETCLFPPVHLFIHSLIYINMHYCIFVLYFGHTWCRGIHCIVQDAPSLAIRSTFSFIPVSF